MNKVKTIFAWIWHKFRASWTWYKSLYQGRAWYTKTVVALASCIVAFILYLGAVDINFLWLFGKSPGYFSGILNPQTSEASLIYSADGKLIGKYFNENRTPVEYEDVNPAFFKALVDTEDDASYWYEVCNHLGNFCSCANRILRDVTLQVAHAEVVRAVEHTAVCITTTIDHVAVALSGSYEHNRTVEILCNQSLRSLRTEVTEENHQGVATLLLYLAHSLEHIFFVLNCSLAVENLTFVLFYDVLTALCRKRDWKTVTANGNDAELYLWNVVAYHNYYVLY